MAAVFCAYGRSSTAVVRVIIPNSKTNGNRKPTALGVSLIVIISYDDNNNNEKKKKFISRYKNPVE